MSDELDAIGKEARHVYTETGQYPCQVRITTGALEGSIAAMPMRAPNRRQRWEVLVHPEDYRKIREETPPAEYAVSPTTGEESVFTIPIVRDPGVTG